MRFCDIHQNFTFHVSFQGKKRFWKSEHGLRSYFIFCAVTPILFKPSPLWKNVEKWGNFKKCKTWRCNFAHNSLVSEPIFKNLFSSESWHAKLSEENRIFEIGSETKELWANLHLSIFAFLKFPLFTHFFIEGSARTKSE